MYVYISNDVTLQPPHHEVVATVAAGDLIRYDVLQIMRAVHDMDGPLTGFMRERFDMRSLQDLGTSAIEWATKYAPDTASIPHLHALHSALTAYDPKKNNKIVVKYTSNTLVVS